MSTHRLYTSSSLYYKDGAEILHSIFLLLVLPGLLRAEDPPSCPSGLDNHKCPCYKFEDGLFLECPGASLSELRFALESVDGPVQSFSVYEMDRAVRVLGPGFLPPGACVRHLHLAHTSLRDLHDEALAALRPCLETLSIVSGELRYVPQKAFAGLNKMISLDLEYNAIVELPGYSFFGLPLIKLNVKGNRLREISEFAFSGLEDTLSEVDLSENELELFPMPSLHKLRLLRSLRLAWNDISGLPLHESSDLVSLVYLDLSSNNFVTIPEDCFASCPSVKILSLHFNSIEDMSKMAFSSLANLESLDLSHNRIKNVNREIFVNNMKLRNIDISHNHIHYIGGIFSNLPLLLELYLTNNNILEVPIDAFTNSTSISVLNLEDNSIESLHRDSLETLKNLTQLHLGYNLVTKVPQQVFRSNSKLVTLSLDNNNIRHLDPKTFKDLVMLREVRLQCNELKFIQKNLFSNCKHLQEIHLQKNNISSIDISAFEGLLNLQHVNLQNNILRSLRAFLPQPSSALVSLHLDGNHLSAVDEDLLRAQSYLQVLWLNHNSLFRISAQSFLNLTANERLYLNDNDIETIDDNSFSSMKSVKCLDIRNNNLRNISSSMFLGLTELEDLHLSNNKISHIMPKAFDMLKKLRNLDLSDNILKVIRKDLFKEGLPLRTLSLQNCSIMNIEDEAFKGLDNLNYLSLRHNLLRYEDVTRIRVPGLKTLDLSFNNLSVLHSNAFHHLPLIQALYIDSCGVNYIPLDIFSTNKKITKLGLSSNYIQDLERQLFLENLFLIELNLSNNMFSGIPYEVFANLSSIETLNLAENQIVAIDIDKLLCMKKLKRLLLNSNQINNIFGFSENILEDMTSLDLSINQFTKFPENVFKMFPNLKKFNISNNKIDQFTGCMFENTQLKEIISFDISNNPIVSWKRYDDKETIKLNILELHISGTEISSVTEQMFKFFKELKHLNLKRNKIEELSRSPFIDLAVLQTLDLSENEVAYVLTYNFIGLKELTSLNLSRNSIVKIEAFHRDVQNLKMLDLSFNEIDSINDEVIENLLDLTDLNLRDNHIQFIADDSFKELKKINVINLMNNELETVSRRILSAIERQIRHFSFEGNPLSCGCEARDLWLWVQDHPRAAAGSAARAHCHKPYWLNGQVLRDVDMPELCELPVVSEIEVYRRGRHSVSVSWQVRNDTAIRAFQIVYYSDENALDIKTELLDENTHSFDIDGLHSSTEYVVCIIAINDKEMSPWNSSITIPILLGNESSASSKESADNPVPLLAESPSSECTTFSTTNRARIVKAVSKAYSLSKILTRRLGLIVGCSMGVVVFILLVSVLGYMKNKKRKLIPDPDQMGSELNYTNSMQSSDDVLQLSTNYSSENILLGIAKKRMSTTK